MSGRDSEKDMEYVTVRFASSKELRQAVAQETADHTFQNIPTSCSTVCFQKIFVNRRKFMISSVYKEPKSSSPQASGLAKYPR